ncbi:MAG: hypothetical protein AAF724_18420 [Pseudomonadota bacterium]
MPELVQLHQNAFCIFRMDRPAFGEARFFGNRLDVTELITQPKICGKIAGAFPEIEVIIAFRHGDASDAHPIVRYTHPSAEFVVVIDPFGEIALTAISGATQD